MNNYNSSTIAGCNATRKMKNAFVFNEEEFRNAFKVQTKEGLMEGTLKGFGEADLTTSVKMNQVGSSSEDTVQVRVLEEEKVLDSSERAADAFCENLSKIL
jgi:hypothetical protein